MSQSVDQTRTAASLGTSHSRNHLANLDFLRGCAAFYVVLFHFSTRVDLAGLMYHGYLAVDFFFCLSGVVIYRSYARKIATGRLGFKTFFHMRLERFMPLVLLGNVLAAAIDLYRPGNFTFYRHLKDIGVTFLLGSFLLPTFTRTSLEDGLFPLNGPVWSLFFELFANVAFFFATVSRNRMPIYAALWLGSVSVMIVAVSILGTAHVGPHPETFLIGFARVLASFFTGVLICKYELWFFSLNRWICAAIMLVVTCMPDLHRCGLSSTYDLVCLFVIIPLVISASCRARGNTIDQVSMMSGEISYPLYCIHYPLVRAISTLMRHRNFAPPANLLICVVFGCLLSLISWPAFRFYDVPLRTKLKSLRRSGNRSGVRERTA